MGMQRATPNRSRGRVHKDHRSECVINLTVEIFGDQWSLLVIRDIKVGPSPRWLVERLESVPYPGRNL